ncbi:Dimethylaniline monooxygenase [Mycena venus]|uniref:Dimethylaniline monooxygenase n=1 Tax=Mycena venus TaxID=2733690 RepID=A0A8H6X8V5_9AGAR|nr:Dimethylaniline monooxygenase [Mycena venus]
MPLQHNVFLLAFLVLNAISVASQSPFQIVFKSQPKTEPTGTFQFHHPIRRVAVVGAGPSGLQTTARLVEHNFTVRLFDRAPHPGGNWQYSEETPVRESYPDRRAGDYYAEIPAQIPTRRYYQEGDDGLTLDYRWREHWRPRPVWYNLFTNSPKVSTELPDVPYDPEVPWVLNHDTIQRHVRSYASHHCLNSNDYCPPKATPAAPPITSYSTRVERVEKDAETHTWVLTLRRLERLPESNRILEEWWTESFDAVFLAAGPWASTHVPDIAGIVDWSKAKVGEQYSVYHSQTYRHPERYAGKAVLIVGSSVSASEIARDISPYAHRIIASVRPPKELTVRRKLSLSRFPNATEIVPEIASFEPLKTHTDGIRGGKIHLVNGSVLQDIDEIILATGYRSSPLYPYNLTTRTPEDTLWSGHWAQDPTIAYSIGRTWTLGRYQAYGIAKVWAGKAQLPPLDRTEDGETKPPSMEWFGEDIFRRYITWLNEASLKYGGRFVDPPPIENLEALKYYSVVHFLTANVTALEDIGLSSISMLSQQFLVEDPWDALVDEDDD